MTAKVLAVIAVAVAFRGSYLNKKAQNEEQVKYSMMVSGGALVLTLVAYLMR